MSPFGCIYHFYCSKLDVSTAIDDNVLNLHSIKIFPNPTEGLLFVKTEKSSLIEIIEVYNSIGQHVETIGVPKGKNLFNFDIKSLNDGLYFLKFKLIDSSCLTKLVIKKS